MLIFRKIQEVTFKSTKRKNNDNKTNEEENGVNDKQDKNMQAMNVSHGGASPLTVENTKNRGEKL